MAKNWFSAGWWKAAWFKSDWFTGIDLSVEPPALPTRVFQEELEPYYPTFVRSPVGSAEDYTGRLIDVLAYDGAIARGEVLLDQTLAQPAESGKICTGIQKLAQRVLLELLTERGTMMYLPDRGTNFMYEARTGCFRTQLDIYGAMSRALVDVRRNLRLEESSSDSDDERYKTAEIIQVVYTPGEAKIWVRVHSQDDNAVGLLPISVTL